MFNIMYLSCYVTHENSYYEFWSSLMKFLRLSIFCWCSLFFSRRLSRLCIWTFQNKNVHKPPIFLEDIWKNPNIFKYQGCQKCYLTIWIIEKWLCFFFLIGDDNNLMINIRNIEHVLWKFLKQQDFFVKETLTKLYSYRETVIHLLVFIF